MSSSTGEQVRAVVLAALMVLSVVAMTTAFAGSAAAQESTLYVDGTGTGSNVYAQVDDALGAASDGDTIVINASGEYSGFTTDVPNVTITTDADGPVEITGEVEVLSDGVTIQNIVFNKNSFTESGNKSKSVLISEGNEVIVENITSNVTMAQEPEFKLYGDDSTIRDSEITQSSTKGTEVVRLGDPSTGADGVILRNNNITNGSVGVYIDDSQSVTIEENTFDLTNKNDAIYVSNVDPVFTAPPESAEIAVQNNVGLAAVVNNDASDSTTHYTVNVHGAVNLAQPGAIVEVFPGTYNESVSISTANVTLESTGGADETIVNGSDTVIDIGSDGVTLRDLKITGGTTGVHTSSNVDNTTISNLLIEDLSANSQIQGIWIERNSEHIVVKDTVIRNLDAGSYVQGIVVFGYEGNNVGTLDDLTFTNNTIENVSTDGDTAWGMQIKGNITGISLQDNVVRNIESPNWWHAGVQLTTKFAANGPRNVTITKNTIQNAGIGVDLAGNTSGKSVSIYNNNIVNHSESGLANNVAGEVNATSNWWGATSGPNNTDNTFIAPGESERGANVSDNVEFTPWLNDSTDDGGQEFAPVTNDSDGQFASIQGAVDDASTDDIITIANGTYQESVTVTTNNTTLRGNNHPTIIGEGVNEGSKPHAAIQVDDSSGPVRNVTIEGFTIENPDGKYGIFAGTGTTNSNSDGIGGLVIRDNVIQDISTDSTGGALTGGPAGIGIRGDYGTDGNPGINISDNKIDNIENLEGGPEPTGITLKSFTGDAGFGFDSNGDPADDPSSPPATDTDILNNEISNISSNGGYATKGISVSGEFEDIDVINNSLTNIESPGGTAIGITFSENNKGDKPEDYKYDIDSDGNGERIGPQDFDIRNNDISQVSAPDARSVNIGGYEELGNHTASRNTISDGAVQRFFGDQAGFDPADADILDARLNWWGNERGPRASSSSGIAGAVGYDPFLVTPAENINADDVGDTQQFAQDVVVPADQEITAVGFPGPTDQTVGEAFSGFNGTIYEYDRENGSFEDVTDGSREISSLDAFVVTQDNNETKRKDVQVVIEYANAAPEDEFPGSKTIEPGFNFIAPRGVGDAYGAFNSPSDRETIYGTYSQPEGDSAFLPVGSVVDPRFVESTFGPEQDDPVVNPYSGYLVFTEEERTITTYVQSGVTADEILNEQNLDRTAE